MAAFPNIPQNERDRLRNLAEATYPGPGAEIRAQPVLDLTYEIIEALYTIARGGKITVGDQPADPVTDDVWIDTSFRLLVWDGGAWQLRGSLKGAAGNDGQDGEDGEDGQDGQSGQDGTDGQDGQDGQDGEDGTRILTGVVTPDLDVVGAPNDLYIELISAQQYRLWQRRTVVTAGLNPWVLLFTSPLPIVSQTTPTPVTLAFANIGTGAGVYRDTVNDVVNLRRLVSADPSKLTITVDAVTGDLVFTALTTSGTSGQAVVQVTGTSTTSVMSQKAVTDALALKQDALAYTPEMQVQAGTNVTVTRDAQGRPVINATNATTVVQVAGASTASVMSQKAVTDALALKQDALSYTPEMQVQAGTNVTITRDAQGRPVINAASGGTSTTFATSAEVAAGTVTNKAVAPDTLKIELDSRFGGSGAFASLSLSGSTLTFNTAAGANQKLIAALTQNLTLALTGLVDGRNYELHIQNTSATGYTLTLPASGVTLANPVVSGQTTLTLGAGKWLFLAFKYNGTTTVLTALETY